ncbi:hypothetical protein U27_02577 [Candidatus Vecturithrix granuli]|uniref:Uncharacterized protein n=1 Tax=Vecturithrix granuli TaxID=1499967 RepID=A0A081CAZ3_VECG1|nr:hypothetical protein U27_02577 [Candidatus Vecturithrix granuli]
MSDEIDLEDHEVDDVAYDTFEDTETVSDVEVFGTEPVPAYEYEGTEGLNDN